MAYQRPGKVKIVDTDKGFAKLVQELGEMGAITIGVQGAEALAKHPNSDLTVGELAAVHELGLGVPRRSWLRDWIDTQGKRLMAETSVKLHAVIEQKMSRKQALIDLGFKWTAEVRQQIFDGKIRPALSAERIAQKGGDSRPLIDSSTLANSITYKIFLPQLKSIRNTAQRMAARGQK